MISKSLSKKDFKYFEESYLFSEISNDNRREFQRRKSSFISELVYLLFNHRETPSELKEISKIIISSLKSSESVYLDKVFSYKNHNPFLQFNFRAYLITLKKISVILKNSKYHSVENVLEQCSLKECLLKCF